MPMPNSPSLTSVNLTKSLLANTYRHQALALHSSQWQESGSHPKQLGVVMSTLLWQENESTGWEVAYAL